MLRDPAANQLPVPRRDISLQRQSESRGVQAKLLHEGGTPPSLRKLPQPQAMRAGQARSGRCLALTTRPLPDLPAPPAGGLTDCLFRCRSHSVIGQPGGQQGRGASAAPPRLPDLPLGGGGRGDLRCSFGLRGGTIAQVRSDSPRCPIRSSSRARMAGLKTWLGCAGQDARQCRAGCPSVDGHGMYGYEFVFFSVACTTRSRSGVGWGRALLT